MIFLIHYDRSVGNINSIREFLEEDRQSAYDARLELEIQLLSMQNGSEVVLLEAPNIEILKRTHRRYFEAYEKMKSGPNE